MSKNPFIKYKKIHFIGAGGVSVNALIKYCISEGIEVSGSDKKRSTETENLKALGVHISIGHDKNNIKGAEAIVYSSAISFDNPELSNAKNVKVYKRSEFLNLIASNHKNSIAVSGSHGKTTTTSMISHILTLAQKEPTAFIGGEDLEYGNFLLGKKNYAVYEACEYKKNILDYTPKIAVVLNVDDDHLESYGSMENMLSAFKRFTLGRISIFNADDKNSTSIVNKKSITFGIKNKADYMALNVRKNSLGYSFTVHKENRPLGRIHLKIGGRHNVYNALASLVVADLLGVSFIHIKNALESFVGVKRRMEFLANKGGCSFYTDYAHHPKEIEKTIKAYSVNKNDILVFQPHTFSRTKQLLKDFINVLGKVDNLVIFKTYPAREKYDVLGSSYTLYKKLKNLVRGNAYYARNKKTLFNYLDKEILNKKRVFFIGAGDIYYRGVEYLKK